MNSITEAWVIQRKDGKFAYYSMFSRQYEFSTRIVGANFFSYESSAIDNICMSKLQDCKPVKVEIKVVDYDV